MIAKRGEITSFAWNDGWALACGGHRPSFPTRSIGYEMGGEEVFYDDNRTDRLVLGVV